MKKKIGLMLALFLIFMSLNFSSDLVYLSELLSTISVSYTHLRAHET